MVERLRAAGYDAILDYSGARCPLPNPGGDHHHDLYVTVRRLPLRDAERLLPKARKPRATDPLCVEDPSHQYHSHDV
jgi:hypothetical protein